ncbi:MAG: hypothetical protein V3V31_08270 [Methylococcales bacterium]
MIGKSGQNGLFRSRFSILGQAPRGLSSPNFVPLFPYPAVSALLKYW